MLSIQPPTSKTKSHTPNLLPCRLHHNGSMNASPRYWNPSIEQSTSPPQIEPAIDTLNDRIDNTQTSYFRGRKFVGKSVPLPERYEGAIVRVTDKMAPETNSEGRREEVEEEEKEEVRVVERLGAFEEVVVWGHESLKADSEDVYVRGIREWIGFAEAMHGDGGEGVDER